jgi:hypothetical protein
LRSGSAFKANKQSDIQNCPSQGGGEQSTQSRRAKGKRRSFGRDKAEYALQGWATSFVARFCFCRGRYFAAQKLLGCGFPIFRT